MPRWCQLWWTWSCAIFHCKTRRPVSWFLRGKTRLQSLEKSGFRKQLLMFA